MPDLHIGGFHFAIHSVVPLFSSPPDRPSTAFSSPPAGAAADDEMPVNVRLLPLRDATPPASRTLFESPVWSMTADGDMRRIEMRGRGCAEPYWVAQFQQPIRRVDVYFGPGQLTADGELMSPLSYPLDQLLLMYLLAEAGGILLHAAGGVKTGGAVYAGPSGAGKTTLTRRLLAEGCEMFSDDRIIVRPWAGGLWLFGTPWPGDANVAANRCAPLAHIYILRKSNADREEPLAPAEALAKIIPCCSLPWFDPPVLEQALQGLNRILQDVPHSILHFTKKASQG